jgi:hypothetical protein
MGNFVTFRSKSHTLLDLTGLTRAVDPDSSLLEPAQRLNTLYFNARTPYRNDLEHDVREAILPILRPSRASGAGKLDASLMQPLDKR